MPKGFAFRACEIYIGDCKIVLHLVSVLMTYGATIVGLMETLNSKPQIDRRIAKSRVPGGGAVWT